MDSDRLRTEEDLRGQLAGDVYCDPLHLQLYASDASVYEIAPLGVVRPRNTNDVAATVRYAAENQIPLHARGSGSGLAGESLGRGLIIDFSRYMTRIVQVQETSVRVQAGVVLDQLNRALARQRRCFGPDPANSSVSTMGSVLALDASGSHRLVYGSARSHILEVEAVLASGKTASLALHAPSSTAVDRDRDPAGYLAAGVDRLLRRYEKEIAAEKQRHAANRCGYRFDDVAENGQIHLARLLAGSEGTLALVTSATWRISFPSSWSVGRPSIGAQSSRSWPDTAVR